MHNSIEKDLNHIVWINEKNRIAYFHPQENYTAQVFSNHEFFINYLIFLQEQGFRFG